MTSVEIILSVFAWLMVLIGAAMLLRTRMLAKLLTKLMEEPEDLFGFGIWTFILGLVILGIGGYTITWTGTLWIVPLLGWLATIKGALLILMPDIAKPLAKPFYKSTGLMMFGGFVALVIGIWLLYI